MDFDEYLNVDSPSDIGGNTLLNPDEFEDSRGMKSAPGYSPVNNAKYGVKLSAFSSDILAGFRNHGSGSAEAASSASKDNNKSKFTPVIPSLSINGVVAHDLLNRATNNSSSSQQLATSRDKGLRSSNNATHQLVIPNTDPSFLFPSLSSNESDNLDAMSSSSNSPYIHPSDALSPGTGYLAVDSDIDELLSVHSDLSDVSKEYQYISNLSELQELTGAVDDNLPDFVDSQFSQLQELTNMAGQYNDNEGHLTDLPMPRIKTDSTNITPPRIKIEQFESSSSSSRPGPTMCNTATTFDTTHSELSTPSTASFGGANNYNMFLDSSKGNNNNNENNNANNNINNNSNDFGINSISRAHDTQSTLNLSEEVSIHNALAMQNELLTVSNLSDRHPLEQADISESFDTMVQGRRNRYRSNSRSHSRSRSTSRKSVSTRSLSPDERARSLSRDREHLLKLGGKASDADEKSQDVEESTLNLIGTTKKKQAQRHPAVYACDICDKKFTRPYNLKSHLRSHTDERPYVCSVCGKAFARMHDKNRHEDLHTGKRRYVCGGVLKNGTSWGCGKKFARSDALGRHFKTELGKKCILPLYEEAELEKRADRSPDLDSFARSGDIGTDGSL
ncbi:unnamed protein product [Kluyveromyces dobzhanskii CBS 2104]|uniref:WGS project CCBQ000000000 data, contig 00017 n=1 Tax=Kluyveromyces dobzhanskii CBS 2104 TaxID=1427455 RepID=A0A0A8L682_9SACH|nr:unnamed protein product [Kluyveromyces dobzhanskii CBS 2104]